MASSLRSDRLIGLEPASIRSAIVAGRTAGDIEAVAAATGTVTRDHGPRPGGHRRGGPDGHPPQGSVAGFRY